MSKLHSPEPWSYKERYMPSCPTEAGHESYLGAFLDANGSEVCWFGNDEQYYPINGDEPSEADCNRILSCVNVLAGIPANDLPRVRKLWDDHKLTAMGHGKPSEILDMMTREQVE